MEIQQKSGVTLCVNSYGGEVETFAQHIIKASTVDTLKFLHDESFELRDRFPKGIATMANAHGLEENNRAYIRRGATNRLADPRTELPSLSKVSILDLWETRFAPIRHILRTWVTLIAGDSGPRVGADLR